MAKRRQFRDILWLWSSGLEGIQHQIRVLQHAAPRVRSTGTIATYKLLRKNSTRYYCFSFSKCVLLHNMISKSRSYFDDATVSIENASLAQQMADLASSAKTYHAIIREVPIRKFRHFFGGKTSPCNHTCTRSFVDSPTMAATLICSGERPTHKRLPDGSLL